MGRWNIATSLAAEIPLAALLISALKPGPAALIIPAKVGFVASVDNFVALLPGDVAIFGSNPIAFITVRTLGNVVVYT